MTTARPLKIAFYLPHLNTGGAEMVFVRLARGLAAHGHDTRFVLNRRVGALLAQTSRPVDILGASRTLTAIPRLAQWLRTATPDVLLSALSPNNLAAILARRWAGTRTAVIIGEHSLLRQQLSKNWKFALLPPLIRALYGHADAVVAVSEAGRRDVANVMQIDPARIDLLPNPAVDADVAVRAQAPASHPWLDNKGGCPVILAAGRLTTMKNYPLLLTAFAKVVATRPCRLILLGEGPDRPALLTLRARLGLIDCVDLPGAVADPLPWFARAAAVVCTSRYEGFGLTLVEAMACGTPVITTEAGGPPAELVRGVGAIVPNDDAVALADAMRSVLDKPTSPALLKERAQCYSTAASVTAYEALFERVLHAQMRPR